MSDKGRALWYVLCLSSLNTTTRRGRNYYYFHFTVVEIKADAWNSYQDSLIPGPIPLSVILYTHLGFSTEFKLSSLKHGAPILWMTLSVLKKKFFYWAFKAFPALTPTYLLRTFPHISVIELSVHSSIYNRLPVPFTCMHILHLGMLHQLISSSQNQPITQHLAQKPPPMYVAFSQTNVHVV